MKTLIYLIAYIFPWVTSMAQLQNKILNSRTESTLQSILDFNRVVIIQPYVYRVPIKVISSIPINSVDVELNFNTNVVTKVKAIVNSSHPSYLLVYNVINNKLLVSTSYNDTLDTSKDAMFIDFYTNSFDSINVSNLDILLNGDPASSIVETPSSLQTKAIKDLDSRSNNSPQSINVYPNPSQSGVFHLDLNNPVSEDGSVEVMDLFGRNIYKSSTSNVNHLTIDLSNVENGTYILKVKSGDSVKLKSLVVKK